MPIKLIIADDHPLVLNGLKQLFEGETDITVLACCSDGDSTLKAMSHQSADILILDLRMPKCSGISVLTTLKQQKSTLKTIVLTAGIDEDELVTAIQLGAKGIVLKETAPEILLECVRKVFAGGDWLEHDAVQRAMEKSKANPRDVKQCLTSRELGLVKLVASGYSNKRIAEECLISEGTVKVHLHNIFEKLGINNRVELCLYAQENNIID